MTHLRAAFIARHIVGPVPAGCADLAISHLDRLDGIPAQESSMSDVIAPLGPINFTIGRHAETKYIPYTAAEQEARMRAHGGIPAVIRGAHHRGGVVVVLDRADAAARNGDSRFLERTTVGAA